MTKSILLFAVTFAAGAALALGARTVLHTSDSVETPSPVAAVAVPPTAAGTHDPAQPKETAAPKKDPAAPAAKAAPAPKAVNTVCPICGMDVDPRLKPAEYKGHLVGFGCRACPPKFAKEPDRYGPAALKNEVVEN
jgi:YHS domain-containing protein